jgi:hypothetical protein
MGVAAIENLLQGGIDLTGVDSFFTEDHNVTPG